MNNMKTLITKTRAVSTLICLLVFLGTIQLNAQCLAGTTWTSSPSQLDIEWKSVTYGNGLFVAVSSSTSIMTSPDGINWTSRKHANTSMTSVTYGNGLYVAVGHNSVMTSNDGITWTTRTSPVNLIWQSVTYGNGIFVAVSSGRVMTSTNGIVWTSQTVTGTWQCITYGNGLFVAVAHNNVMTSPDGNNWTSRTTAANNQWQSVTYGNGIFVAVAQAQGGTENTIMTSPDGVIWTSRNSVAKNTWDSVTYGNGLFVAVAPAIDGTGNTVMTSPDGITWTGRTSAATNFWSSVTYGNGLFVAVSSTGKGNRVMTSPDGNTWTSRSTSAVNNNWLAVTYGNGLFVAVANSGTGNRVMTSPDAINWRNRTSAADNEWRSVTYGNGLFVAVASSTISGVRNQVMTSPDGITWTIRTSAIPNKWSSITYGNGLFVAVANSGTRNRVMTSPDGITWTSRTSAADSGWISVTYGKGVFVAVASSTGTSNRVMTSPDGITWTSQTSATDSAWGSVTYGNGVFVAVSNSSVTNSVMTSFDGITWTGRNPSNTNIWSSVTYGNGLFVAVSVYNAVMTSPDGINWTSREVTNSGGAWISVTYGNGVFVAVSATSTNNVMTSSPSIVPPSVSIAANPGNSITTGTSVVFTATPTNGGSTPAYQWKKNNNNVGSNSVTYTDTALVNGDIITCVLTSNDPCASPVTATSTGITMAVSPVLPVLNQTFTSNGINYIVTKATLPYEVAVGSNTSFVGVATIPATVMNSGNEFNVTAIGQSAFNGCAGLTSVVIPNSVLTINDRAFYTCSNLSNVVVPNALTTIGKYAFLGCSNLVRIAIPETVTSIGDWAFSDCHKLATVNIPNTITVLNTGVFSGCLDLSTITLPTNLSSIGAHSFEGCSGLSTISLPSTITDIMTNAFANCTGLKAFTVNWTTPLVITTDVFSGVNLLNVQLNVPPGTIVVYDEAAVWQDFNPTLSPPVVGQSFAANGINYIVTKATLPYEVAVGNNAGFSGDAVVPATVFDSGNEFNVTAIGESAFHGCTELTSVSIPNSVITIDRQAFYDCYSLASVTIPNSVVSIGHAAFGYNFNLTSLTLGSGLTNIGVSAFYGCNVLTEVTIPNGVTTIGNEAFRNCTAITALGIPSSVTSFGNNVFTDCRSLNTVTLGWTTPLAIDTTIFEFVNLAEVKLNIPVGTKAAYLAASVWNEFNPIGEPGEVFLGEKFTDNGINYIVTKATTPYEVAVGSHTNFVGAATITASVTNSGNSFAVTSVGNNAFYGCTGLTAITIPNSVTSIGTGAFTFCPFLTSISFPNTLTSIGNSAFTSCFGLTSINIPKSVTSIGDFAFGSCIGLTEVSVNWTTPLSIPTEVFNGLNLSRITLNVPLGTERAYKNAAVWTDFRSSTLEVNYCKGAIATPLTAPFPAGSTVRWYTAATGGRALTTIPTPTTTTVGTKLFYVSNVVAGVESPRETITVNTIALPATPTTIMGIASQGALVGTDTTANYSISPVDGAVNYTWTAPTGVNIVDGQGTNEIIVNFADVPAGAGAIGNLSVVAINSNDCNSLPKTLAITKALPKAPAAVRMTDASLPVPISGIPTAVSSFAKYMGTTKAVTLTATEVEGASSYEWELPAGVTQLSGGTTNVIMVNFAGVTIGNTHNFTTSKGVSTNILRIGAKAINGTGASVTSNTALLEPTTSSTAKLLTLAATAPTAPSAIKLTDDDAIDPLKAVTVITTFLGTNKVLKLTATASALASSYSWELPAGVNQLSGGNSNVITVDFMDVASGTTNLYIGVKAINGIGSSVTTNLAPNATSTARLLKLTATVPATVTAVTGQIAALCGGATYSYTITPTALATAYTITAPTGAVVQSATRMSNSSNILTTADLVFTVQYPSGFVANAASPQTLAVASENRVGRSLTNRVLTLSTAMPSIGTLTGSAGITNFRRTGTQTFTAPAVLGATTYTWTVANGATIVSGQGTATVTVNFAAVPTTTASTKVSVVATNACGASTAIKSISLRSATAREAAIETLTVNTTEVYPNPVSSVFNVDVTASKAGILAITIYSLDGIVVMNSKAITLNAGANTISENIASLKSGVYILQLVNATNSEVISKKLIKN